MSENGRKKIRYQQKSIVSAGGKQPTDKGGGPYTLQIFDGKSKVVLKDILLGEVWLCSGQSNMEWAPNNGLTNIEREVSDANCPDIRIFNTAKRASRFLQEDCHGQWETCTPEVMRKRSSVAYFFARHLRDSLKVPVGIMISAWGGMDSHRSHTR